MKKSNKVLALVSVLVLSMILTIPAFATGGFENPPFSIDRTCDGAYYTGTLGENETAELQAELWTADPWLGGSYVWDTTVSITTPGDFNEFIPWGVDPDGLYYRVAISLDGTIVAAWEEYLDCPPPPDGEVCSPGYWKNHPDSWVGYSPDDDFDTVFGVDYFDPDITLLEAAGAKGGGVNRIARLGTAALLNAAALNAPYTEAAVIAAVQSGDISSIDSYPENCPID